MHVAFEFQEQLRLRKRVGQIRAAGHLHVVVLGLPDTVGVQVDVVDAGVGIFDDEFLAGLDRQNLRRIEAAFLIEHDGRRARAGGFAGDTLQRNHHVGQFVIRADDVEMRGGDRS
jgi:hypothetical protein